MGSTQSTARPRQFGKYLLLEKIGSGGMAEIFKAVAQGAEDFRKVIVIKRILLPYSRDPNFVKMFVEEAKITAPLSHANIVSIYEFDQVDGQYYLAMEYVHGRDLQQVMARANRLGRQIPTSVAVYIVGEVCKALWYAYNARDPYGNPLRIIHRDVSPSNILISYDGEVKVTDFGVAKAATSSEDGSGVLKGKLGYMSPEQVLGREVDHRSDIFSLGIILFELLTLKRLFLGRTDLQTIMNIRNADVERRLARHPEIPAPIADILRRALAKEPERRYQNAEAFYSDLQDYLYSTGKRVGAATVQALMRDLFPEESEAEILPLEIEELSEVKLGPTGKIKVVEAPPKVAEPQEEAIPEKAQGEPPLPFEEVSGEMGVARREATAPSRGPSPREYKYFLKDAEGLPFGPLTFDNLVSLLQSYAVHEDEFCSVGGGEWVRLGDIPFLKEYVPSARVGPGRGRLLYEGAIEPENILGLFYDVMWKKRLTGLLSFRSGNNQKGVFLRGGRPKLVTSNLRTELLGAFLVKRGTIAKEDLEGALREKTERERLGDALVARRKIEAHELAEALEEQFRERFFETFGWSKGWYGVFEDAEMPKAPVLFDLDPLPALAEAARRAVPIEVIRSVLFDRREHVLLRNQQSPIRIEEFRLVPREMKVVSLLDSYRTIGELVAHLPRSQQFEETAYRVIYLLVQTEVYRFKGERRR